MIRRFAVAAIITLGLASPSLAADGPCDKLTGQERAACEKAEKAGKNRADEMKGVGSQGKGQGAEKGKGIAKQGEQTAGEMKDKAKDKVKDKAKDEAKEKIKGKSGD